eukprot:Skav227833  [mRNA]  locus=scaffold948:407608:410269:+ [translate_table: standard]
MARAIWPQPKLFRGAVALTLCVAFVVPKDGLPAFSSWSLPMGSKSLTGHVHTSKPLQDERWRQLRGIQRRQGTDSDEAVEPSKATVVSTGVSLAKGMLGSGALSLSAGAAAFTQSSQGLVVATIIILSMTLLSGYTFQMVAESSSATTREQLISETPGLPVWVSPLRGFHAWLLVTWRHDMGPQGG